MSDPFAPSPSLLVKLGSLVVHYEELNSPNGHEFDQNAIDNLLADSDVVEWRAQMDALGMLPVKR